MKRIAQQDIIKDDQIRSPGAKLLIGSDTTLIQTENGVSYKFDLTKEMFRLSFYAIRDIPPRTSCRDRFGI